MYNPPHVSSNMDAVIDYDKAAGFLKKKPSLEPCPNFTNIVPSKNTSCKHSHNFLAPKAPSTVGGPCDEPPHIPAFGRRGFHHPTQSRFVSNFSHWGCRCPNHRQNDPSNIRLSQKLLLVIQEHNAGVLLHAQCLCIQTV